MLEFHGFFFLIFPIRTRLESNLQHQPMKNYYDFCRHLFRRRTTAFTFIIHMNYDLCRWIVNNENT